VLFSLLLISMSKPRNLILIFIVEIKRLCFNIIAIIQRTTILFINNSNISNTTPLSYDETFEECLKRECSEEIGYNLEIVEYIGKLSNYTRSTKHDKYFKLIGHFYIGKLLDPNCLKIEEDHELIWMPIKEAVEAMQEEFQAYAIKEYIKQQNL
jgi:8-oxo-dGTP diphosphatase